MVSAWVTVVGSLGAGVSGGLLAGLFGVGGAVILIPMLGLVLGLNQHQAQGTALAAMLLPNGLPAVLYMKRVGIIIHWSLVLMIIAGFLPAVWVGAALANMIPEAPLRMGFASLLVVLAARNLLQKTETREVPPSAAQVPFARVWLPGLAIGIAGGVASGLLGIGGAILMIPLMVWLVRIPQHEAQATSLVVMLAPIGLPGVWVYARHGGGLPWLALAGVAVGFLGGAYLGARVAVRTRGRRLRQGFALLMLVSAVLLFMKGTGR
ncbi:MAG: sulfite exporter TauE/SafE family protein [Holophaga sp.]|nr:sulfite exporter TauE/SafE family protein [Holophaga sp.]